jgi:hypothetical protein
MPYQNLILSYNFERSKHHFSHPYKCYASSKNMKCNKQLKLARPEKRESLTFWKWGMEHFFWQLLFTHWCIISVQKVYSVPQFKDAALYKPTDIQCKHQGGLYREHDIKTLWLTNIDSEKGLMSTLFFLHQHPRAGNHKNSGSNTSAMDSN